MESSTSEAQPRGQSVALANGTPSKSSSGPAPEAPATIVPPYWRHHRHTSDASSLNLRKPPPISLEDHTEAHTESNRALWAKSVTIPDYVVVKGSRTGVGAYVVWTCRVQTLDGGPMTIRKRYSEFDDLRCKLAESFPDAGQAMPQLPPKSVLFKFRPNFLEKRRVGLEYFLNCVLLNPAFSGSPVLKDFLFS